MRMSPKLIMILAVLSVFMLIVSACQQGDSDVPIENNTANKVTVKENVDYIKIDHSSVDFELEDLSGNKIKLSDYKGQLVFLNFWATWCPPCREEMSDMEAIHQQYGDKGVVILAVSSTGPELRWRGNDSQKAESQVREFIEKEGYTFTIALDPNDQVYAEYSNIFPINGIPTTFMMSIVSENVT